MTPLNKPKDFHSKFPGSAHDGRPESLDTKSLDDMKCEMRKSQNIFYVCYDQEMPATKKKTLEIDQELRKYFGFGKRQFKNIVKKPGNKFGFKLSNYIHVGDSPKVMQHVLSEIASHIEFTKTPPVKAIFHKNFKDELRANSLLVNPRSTWSICILVLRSNTMIKKSMQKARKFVRLKLIPIGVSI